MTTSTSTSNPPPFKNDELTWDGENVEFSVWVKRGPMMVNRHGLDEDDPDLPYNLLKRYGLNPSEFKIFHPLSEQFVGKTRAELIELILELSQELTAYKREFG